MNTPLDAFRGIEHSAGCLSGAGGRFSFRSFGRPRVTDEMNTLEMLEELLVVMLLFLVTLCNVVPDSPAVNPFYHSDVSEFPTSPLVGDEVHAMPFWYQLLHIS